MKNKIERITSFLENAENTVIALQRDNIELERTNQKIEKCDYEQKKKITIYEAALKK